MSVAFKIAFVVLYSEKFAMTGETHGVSVLAGVVQHRFNLKSDDILILDMYGLSVENKMSYISNSLMQFNPDIIGFSCPYGSYSTFAENYFCIYKSISKSALTIFGGALPTYIPEKYLELDKTAYVIRGEGEDAIVGLVDMYLKNYISLRKNIPNICYFENGKIEYNNRKLVELSNVVKPYREHLGNLLKKDSQIYVEHSRGCFWGNCSFCSRNLLSLDRCKRKYRTFDNERLIQDLQCLKEKGISSVTFSDEDFCGSGIAEMKSMVEVFKRINCYRNYMLFDVSMNVNSIYSNKWSEDMKNECKKTLLELKRYGLRKVFLGVESGSDTQLRRYKKQQSVSESIYAIRILEECGIEIEIGYIVFDPLCTIEEVKEDFLFLHNNNFAGYVSSLGSGLDLRLHMDTSYVKMLLQFEKENNVCLHSNTYNLDTLNYLSGYLDKDVERMARYVKEINAIIRPFYYPLKSLSRYGSKGSLEENVTIIKDLVIEIRNSYLKYLLELIEYISNEKVTETIVLDVKSHMGDLYIHKKDQLLDIALKTNNLVLLNLVKEYSLGS